MASLRGGSPLQSSGTTYDSFIYVASLRLQLIEECRSLMVARGRVLGVRPSRAGGERSPRV